MLGRNKPTSLLRHHMQKLWTLEITHVLQGGDETGQIMAVNRADVVKSDFLEQGGWTHHPLDVFFRFLRKLSQWRQRFEEPPCLIATPCVGF